MRNVRPLPAKTGPIIFARSKGAAGSPRAAETAPAPAASPASSPASAPADGARPSSAAHVVGIDHRRAPRIRRKSRAQLLLYPSGRHPHPIDVTIVDFSATGIGIVHNEGLLIGQKFIVREPHVTQGNTCLFTVVRSEKRPDGTYSIGLHVGNSLADELEPMVQIAPAPGLSRWDKLLFLLFSLLGATTIVLWAILQNRAH